MTAFWIAAAALTVVALALMIVPLLRKTKPNEAVAARAEFDLTVYKDQLQEIERDQERGVLSADQATAARTEIERRMLAVADEQDTGAPKDLGRTASVKALAASIVVAVPVGAVAFYLYLGSPGLEDQPLVKRQQDFQNHAAAQAAGGGEQSGGDMRAKALELLAQLDQRLKDNPKDVEGWLIKAQIYEAMNQYGDAAASYEQAAPLTDRHPEILTAWAEALIVSENTQVIPAAAELLKEIKQKDPAEPRAYFYLALERQQHGDLQGALDEYVSLLKVSPSDAEWVPQIQSRMEGLASGMGVETPVVEMLPPAGPPPGMAAAPEGPAPGPTAEQVRDAQQMSEDDQNAMIQAMVQRLADRLKENPDDLAGWKRLAQAYRVLGDMAKVAEAEAQIKRLEGE